MKRQVSDAIALKRWRLFHETFCSGRWCGGTWSRGVFRSLTIPPNYSIPVGRYRKWNGCCAHCSRRRQTERSERNEALRTEFRASKSRIMVSLPD